MTTAQFDKAWTNARLATFAGDRGVGLIEDGAVAATAGRIAFVGRAAELPATAVAGEVFDCGGRLLTPGIIDCHTHLVHAGNRSNEFAMRLAGAGYEEIARAGGGIISTMTATRAASEDRLLAESLPRLDALIAEGVTTIEIKSGYGLVAEAERRQLVVARRLGEVRPVAVATSFLGAHAVPPEHKADRAAYLRAVVAMLEPMAREGLIDAVDAFCERIAFTREEVAEVFAEARRLGLPVKLHADQLSNGGGAALAAEWDALSADHLEHADEAGVRAMAAAGVVAVLLPGAYYCMRETKAPPVALFRKHGVPMAVATDCNPGTSPLTSILLAMNMAAVLFGLSVEEALAGATREAARALGRLDRIGTIEVGKACDLAIWDAETPADLVLRLGQRPLHRRVWRGE